MSFDKFSLPYVLSLGYICPDHRTIFRSAIFCTIFRHRRRSWATTYVLTIHTGIVRCFDLPFVDALIQKRKAIVRQSYEASYTLEGTVLENVDSIKYLGVTITNDLKWNTHINNICTKANRTLGFLRRNLFSCPQDVKEAAYKGLVRPVLEYGSSVWDPHTKCLQEELEKVQNRAARFVTRNYTFEEGSMTGILEQLRWESLKKRRTDNRLILLYKGLKGKARIPRQMTLSQRLGVVEIATPRHFSFHLLV